MWPPGLANAGAPLPQPRGYAGMNTHVRVCSYVLDLSLSSQCMLLFNFHGVPEQGRGCKSPNIRLPYRADIDVQGAGGGGGGDSDARHAG